MPEYDVRLEEVAPVEAIAAGISHISAPAVTSLRFRIEADPVGLEALRYARRALIREEAIRGLDADEPSLEQATFSPAEIVWEIRPSQRARCLEKLDDLVSRARRARDSALSLSDTASRRSTRTPVGE